MNHQLVVSDTILIHAPIEKVWEGLTNPQLIKQYLYGTETITDWKVGSGIIFQGEFQNIKYKDKGVVKENILHEKIAYYYWSGFSGMEDIPQNYSLVTYLLEKTKEGIKLTWIQQGFANETGYNHTKNGMPSFLMSIKQVIEN